MTASALEAQSPMSPTMREGQPLLVSQILAATGDLSVGTPKEPVNIGPVIDESVEDGVPQLSVEQQAQIDAAGAPGTPKRLAEWGQIISPERRRNRQLSIGRLVLRKAWRPSPEDSLFRADGTPILRNETV